MKPYMLIAMSATVILANFYVFFRLWQMMPPTTIGRAALVVAAVICTFTFFLYFIIGNMASSAVLTPIYKVGTSWIMILLYFVMLLAVIDLLRLVRVLPRDFIHNSWAVFCGVIGVVVVIMTIGYVVYTQKKRTEISITTDKNISQPLRIVAISDLHLGYGIGRGELSKWIEMINAENPDVVLIGGDLVDTDPRPLMEQNMAEEFQRLRTRYGVFVILGNHEYISHSENSRAFFDDAGITVLRDHTVLVDSTFYIVGRDDRTNPDRESLATLVQNLDPAKFIISLDHQPFALEEAPQNGIDLQFSGHTHHGQVWPISLITSRIYELSWGHLKKGGTDIYVSSGLGIWGGKFRIGTRSEYVVIDISQSK